MRAYGLQAFGSWSAAAHAQGEPKATISRVMDDRRAMGLWRLFVQASSIQHQASTSPAPLFRLSCFSFLLHSRKAALSPVLLAKSAVAIPSSQLARKLLPSQLVQQHHLFLSTPDVCITTSCSHACHGVPELDFSLRNLVTVTVTTIVNPSLLTFENLVSHDLGTQNT